MVINHTETSTSYFITNKSVLYGLDLPSHIWNLPDETTTRWIIAAVISIASPVITLLNILVVVILNQKKESKKRPGNILMSSLAGTDILVGAVCMTLCTIADWLIFDEVSFKYGCTLDYASVHLHCALYVSSLCHLTMIAWERYVAIRKWKDYRNILTERRLKTLAVIGWISGLFLTFLKLIVGGVRENPFVHAIRSWYGTVIGNVAVALIVYFYIMI